MSPRKILSGLVATGLIFAVGCSSDKKEKKSLHPVTKAIYENNQPEKPISVESTTTKQVDFATVEFDRGESRLSEMDQRHLNELTMKMTGAGKVVEEVKILTWPDRVVKNDQDASNTEIILARQRAESIKNYIQKNLPENEEIDFYNMAENPERYSKYMQKKGIPVNQAFTDNGQKLTTPDSRALIVIEYQGGPSPSTL